MESPKLPYSKIKETAKDHNQQKILTFLKNKGIRCTPQRQLVVEIVQRTQGHASAEEIHTQLQKRFPKVNLSTVYRTLELLCELGLMVEVVNWEDHRKRFEVIGQNPHYHLLCQGCKTILEVKGSTIHQLETETLERYGFKLALNHFIGYSYCSDCKLKLSFSQVSSP